jgi:hypothetical protein
MLKNKNMIDLLPPFEANSLSIGLGFVVGNMIWLAKLYCVVLNVV